MMERILAGHHNLFGYAHKYWLEHLKLANTHSLQSHHPWESLVTHLSQMCAESRPFNDPELKLLRDSNLDQVEEDLIHRFDELIDVKNFIEISLALRKILAAHLAAGESLLGASMAFLLQISSYF